MNKKAANMHVGIWICRRHRKNKRLWKAYGPCPLRIIRKGQVVETIGGRRGD